MSGHTKEPWRYLNDAGKFMQADQWTVSYEGQAASASSAFIFAGETPVAAIVEEAFEYKSDAPLLKANARRIVACVNACAGIPTDVLEAMPSGQPALEQQRDNLLAALESLLSIASDSEGVAGYYLDGAVANWDEFPEVKKADLLVSWLSVDSLGEL